MDGISQRTFQHWLPEQIDHTLRLPTVHQPGEGFLRLLSARPPPDQLQHPTGESHLFNEIEVRHGTEQGSKMQGRREPGRRGTPRPLAIGPDEPQFSIMPQLITNSAPLTEIQEVGAAAHRDMLAGIDEPTRLTIGE